MKSLEVGRYALSISVAAALLAGCGGSQLPIGAPGAMPQTPALSVPASSANYKIVYSFAGGQDGAIPHASLVRGGRRTLYGTTFGGGSYSCTTDFQGCGTVFSVTLSGAEKVLYRFGGPPDGNNPNAGLIDVKDTLYGTTSFGGGYCFGTVYADCGTVFSITPSGAEKVLHTFGGDPGGAYPYASLIDVNGTLYGTTSGGGTYYGYGTVFSITTGGTQKVVYTFRAPHQQGSRPRASLIDVSGMLYGTTLEGGAYFGSCITRFTTGCGTVFSVTPGGKERVLHSFGNGFDGREPYAGLIEVKGTFYGTTRAGGAHGDGTVFSITPSGPEKVLYSFAGGADGALPSAGLINVAGTLYGTTSDGGGGGCYNNAGCGIVFSVTTTGTEKVLHSFGAGSDGTNPQAGLTDVNGTLYGTTSSGGTHNQGTVFALTP